jgi:hypothetical protein
MLRKLWKSLTKKTASRNTPRGRGFALETLEDRCVPATYTWIGPSGGLWSNPANWSGGPPNTVPTAGSSVFYNTATSSIDDLSIPSPGLNLLAVGPSAGLLLIKGSLQQAPGTLTLQEGGVVAVSGSLANGGTVEQFAATMGVTATGVFSNSGVYDFFGGSILGPGMFLNGSPGQQGDMVIGNGGNVTEGVNLANYGQITWQSGNITLERTLTNMSGGTIAIDTPGTLSGANGYLVNNVGGTITASTNGTATIDVLLGTSNTNYGLILVSSGTLTFAESGQFTNEGRIGATGTSGSSLIFEGSFAQQANTQKASYTPLLASFAADSFYVWNGGVFNAGQLSVLGLGDFLSTTFYSLTINNGATATFDGALITNFSISDSGSVAMAGGNMTLGVAGEMDISAGGSLIAYPASNQDYIYGDIYNSGRVTIYAGAQFQEGEPLYSQSASGATYVNGTPSTSSTTVFQVDGTVDITGGTFNVSNATINTQGPQGFIIEAGAVLNFTAGPNTVSFNNGFGTGNSGVTILGAMNFADGNNDTVNFNNGLTLGSTSSTAVVSLYLTDVINVTGTTNFGSAVFDFLNVPQTPTTYTNINLGTVVGTPIVNLPPGWNWAIVGGVLVIS